MLAKHPMAYRILFLLVWLGLAWRGAAGEPLAIIVNRANTVEQLKLAELGWIFCGKKERWPDGQKVVVINRPVDQALRRLFYQRVYHAEPSLKFFKPGSPVPFTTLMMQSDEATVRFVARIPNAISYVSPSAVDDSVRVLAIENW